MLLPLILMLFVVLYMMSFMRKKRVSNTEQTIAGSVGEDVI